MKITKIAGLSEEEQSTLVEAGKILGSFKQAKAEGTIDTLTEETVQLFEALKKVLEEL